MDLVIPVKKCVECPFAMMIDPKRWFYEEGLLYYLWCRLDVFTPLDPKGEFGYTTNETGICNQVRALNDNQANGETFESVVKFLKEIGWLIPMEERLRREKKFMLELEQWKKQEEWKIKHNLT